MMKINLTIDAFREKYYYVKELKELAKQIGVKNVSLYRKDELETLIEQYLISGILSAEKRVSKKHYTKDSESPLTEDKLIVHYTNDKATRDFLLSCAKQKDPNFKKKSGSSYWLNRWREEQIATGKKITYGNLVEQYVILNSPEYPTQQIPSTKMNNFIQDYLENEENSDRVNALQEWEKLKGLAIEKTYISWKEYKNRENGTS